MARGDEPQSCEAVGDWGARAACRGLTRLFALPIWSGRYGPDIAAACALCAECPVLAECREWALSEPDPATGMIAAGMTPRERQEARGRCRRRAS